MEAGALTEPTVEEMIPHRGPMRLVDRVISADGAMALVATAVRPDWPLVEAGGVNPLVLLEVVAQAAGLLMGRRHADEPMGGRGWLVGIKHATLAPGRVPVGSALEVEVEIATEVDMYVVFRGRARLAGRVLAEAEIQTFRPAEMAGHGSEE